MTSVCSRCGAMLSPNENHCSVCGLNRDGGRGIIKIRNDKIPINKNTPNRESDIFDKIKDHKIKYYYDMNSLTDAKLYSEKERIRKEIEKIDNKILSNIKNPLEHLFPKKRKLEGQLETIYDYISLKYKAKMIEEISKYYDLESFTQEKLESELKRLHKEIEDLENTLIFMEKEEPGHPDKMKFYEERIIIRDQLNTIYDFLSTVEHERIDGFMRDSKLRTIYGKLPEWRKEQIMKKKSRDYYNLKY